MASRCSAGSVVFGLRAVSVIGVVGFLTLVAAEATAERRLALRSLTHEAARALRATEATRTLGCHAKATEAGLNARRGRAVPGSRRRLVAELAERCGG